MSPCAVIGLDRGVVEVEVDVGGCLPKMVIFGLPDAAVQESRERVQLAVRNAGFYYSRKKLTFNLALASVRKESPSYDLLIATDQLDPETVEKTLIIGEFSLDGSVCYVKGVLPMAALTREEGYKIVIVSAMDAPEAALIPNIQVINAPTLNVVYNHLMGTAPLPSVAPPANDPAEALVER